MKHIPIFFSIDDNYAKYLSVTIESIIENRRCDYILDFYILNTGLNSNTIETLETMVKASNDNIYFVDMKEALYMLEGSLFTRDYYSKTTYYRLFIPRLFPNIDKGIYLDGDIVLNDDIINLYDIDLSNKSIHKYHL